MINLLGIELEEAVELLIKNCNKIKDIVRVDILESEGHILADDIVAGINNPPFITTIDNDSAIEDQLYSEDYNATDEDGDILTWSLNTNATFLSITTDNGILSGTPTNDDFIGDDDTGTRFLSGEVGMVELFKTNKYADRKRLFLNERKYF